jgi:hypothetical protein
MKHGKASISARISPLAVQIMEIERKVTGESQGALIERLIMSNAKSKTARKLMAKAALKDPEFVAKVWAIVSTNRKNA